MKQYGVLLVLMAIAQPVFGWGAQGHRVVGQVAEKRLAQSSPAALKRAEEFLRANNNNRDCEPCDDARSFSAVANNADDFRQIELALVTREWHFVNIDIANATYDEGRDCPNGDCVVRRIDRMVEILRNSRNNCDRESALIYLIHFMGDMHQPFHAGFGRLPNGNSDLGANLVQVTFDGQQTNLHSVWDTRIIEKQGRSDAQWVTRLMTTTLNGRDPEKLAEGTTTEWVNGSHKLAAEFHTTNKPFNETTYVAAAVPVIEEQLLLAGLRLARLIEEAVK